MRKERPPHPGLILKEQFLDPLGISPACLARSMGVSAGRVTDLLAGRRGITTDTAIRLGLFFDVPPAWFLEMQARYDTECAPRVAELRECVIPYEGLSEVLVTPRGVRHLPPSKEPEPQVMLVRFPEDLVERLEAQAALDPPRKPRHVRTVTYENGAVALVGSDEWGDSPTWPGWSPRQFCSMPLIRRNGGRSSGSRTRCSAASRCESAGTQGPPRRGTSLSATRRSRARLRLLADRPQDLADVRALIEAGADVAGIRAYLGEHAPDLVPVLAGLVP